MENLKIGLIIGGGTGEELGEVFRLATGKISQRYGVPVEIREFEGRPKTYFESRSLPVGNSIETEKHEVIEIETFIRNSYSDGYGTFFRTAINAGTLYQLRKRLEMVKVMPFETPKGRILLVRDMMNGFYAIGERVESDEEIRFTGSFSKRNVRKIIEYAVGEAQRYFDGDFQKMMIFKYHLFDGFERYVSGADSDIKLYQPDTGIDELMRKRIDGDVLAIVANEVGDMLVEFVPLFYGIGNKETMFSRDVSLNREIEGLRIYQTVHGSADNIAGKGIVNPIATLKATAAIFEEGGNVDGVAKKIDVAISQALERDVKTHDSDGEKTTKEVADFILNNMG